METLEREPCHHCGEPVLRRARSCPSCQRSVLVHVALDAPVADGRARYGLARAIVGLDAELGTLGQVQTALGEPRPRLAPVTRELGGRVLELLAASGQKAALQAASSESPRAGWRPALLVSGVSLAVAALAVGALAALMFLRPRRPVSSAPEPAPTMAAAVAGEAELGTRELARLGLASTVLLRCRSSLGTGFAVGPETVMTNAHVLCPAGEPMRVETATGLAYSGTTIESDARLDLALVRVPGLEAPALPLGDAGALEVGDPVVVVGNPMGVEFSVSAGVVSRLGYVLFGVAYVQTDAKVNPGNSGGPMLDAQGRVVGVVSLKHTQAEGIAWALPINYAWTGVTYLPTPEGESPGWQQLKARAQEENDVLAEHVARSLSDPVLVDAFVDQYQRLVMRLGQAGRSTPRAREVTVHAYAGGERFCTMKGDVNEWTARDRTSAEGRTFLSERVIAWMESNGLDSHLYVGEAPLRWDQCPRERMRRGVVFELEDGNPEANRVTWR